MDTITKEKISDKEILTKKHHLVLFNDDVNTFDFVIEMLIQVCNHTTLQAEQCAYLVHHKGKCSIKEGDYNVLKPMADILLNNGLTCEIN